MNLDAMKDDIKGELSEGDWTPEKMIQEFTDTVWNSVQELNEEKFKRDEFRLKSSAIDEARVEFCDALDTYLEMMDGDIDRKTLEEAEKKIRHKLNEGIKEDRVDHIDKVIQDFLRSLG